MYVFEVVYFDYKQKFIHIGYMDKQFKTRNDAKEYYLKHNKGMRKIISNISDWNPKTRLAYIIRKDKGINKTIKPFDE